MNIVIVSWYTIDIFYQGESCLRTEDILDVLRREGQSIALVMIGGVHYYTGQLFDIETITRVAHEQVQLLIFRIYSWLICIF
jgi:kynureninase